MQTTYKTAVTQIGPLANEMLDEGMIIIFDENAPAAVAEISVLHTRVQMDMTVKKGDIVIFDKVEYNVTAVGEQANKTLKSMGHCTFAFTGADKAELPGQIVLSPCEAPYLTIGGTIEIKSS